MQTHYELYPIGRVESPLVDRELAPKQGDQGAPVPGLSSTPQFAREFEILRSGQKSSC